MLLAFCLSIPGVSSAEPTDETDGAIEDGIAEWLDRLNLDAWDEALSQFSDESRSIFSNDHLSKWVFDLAMTGLTKEDEPLTTFENLFFAALKSGGKTLAVLMGIAILSAIIAALSNEQKNGLAESAAFLIRCMALSVVLSVFLSGVTACAAFIHQAANFLEIAFPALLTLLTAIGGTASAGVLQPASLLLTGTITKVLHSVILPLTVAGGIMGILDKLFEKSRLGELSKLSSKIAKWLIGAVSTIFIGSTSLKSIAAATFDGVSLKSAKYAAGSLIPIVGGMVSGTMDTMLGCAVLVKSSAGIAAFLITFAAALTPLLKAAAGMVILRMSSAIAEPIADPGLSKLYSSAADAISALAAVTIASALLFLSLFGIMVLIGNAGVI